MKKTKRPLKSKRTSQPIKPRAVKPKKVKDDRWTRLSLFFFRHWFGILLIWIIGVVGSVFIYLNVIPKDGFPNINPPSITISGHYFVNDVQVVDERATKPLHELLGDIEEIEYINSNSYKNNFLSRVSLKVGSDEEAVKNLIDERIERNKDLLPDGLEIEVETPSIAKYLDKYDVLIALYDQRQVSNLASLEMAAETIMADLRQEDYLTTVEIVPLSVPDPTSGENQRISFNRLGISQESPTGQREVVFYRALHIGLERDIEKIDYLRLATNLEKKIAEINSQSAESNYQVKMVADFGAAVQRNLDSLESNLLTGLIVIGILSFLLISWRASIVIALFMVSVLAVTILFLHLIGYSLNIITLFALILALGLLVDDAVIMVEALDLYKQKNLKNPEVIRRALKRILLASLAGTLTTVLVFIPLAFTSGLLGEFIRYIPLTLGIILLTSFFFSITLIPVLARWTILREKRRDWFRRYNPILKLEKAAAEMLARIPALLKTKPLIGKYVVVLILTVAGIATFYSFSLFNKLEVVIFPDVKDTSTIYYSVTFPAGYSLEEAETAAAGIDDVVAEKLKDELLYTNYISFLLPNQRTMWVTLELRPLSERSAYSSVLAQDLQKTLNQEIPEEIEILVNQSNPGPSGQQYPFSITLKANDKLAAQSLAEEIQNYLQSEEFPKLETASGKQYEIEKARFTNPAAEVSRLNENLVISVEARYNFGGLDQTVIDDTEEAVLSKFDADYLKKQGYNADVFEVPSTVENYEDSFNSLGYVFIVALLFIYGLLIWQFKSILQPLMLFTALPFAAIGVANWLFITKTPMSFIVGVGFITLMGIVINNTILLTTYANAARRKVDRVEAISLAVKERFRPMLLTTLTTILALLPLALNDFFWQNLALTIIWGLASSTLGVLLVFPYFYLLFTKFIKVKKESNPNENDTETSS